MRADSFNTGLASEYLILSKLYRLELEAYMSQGNKKSIDIRVIRENGTSISIDVKSVRGYSSLVVNNVIPKDNHFIVFVIYNNKFENLNEEPDIYIVPSTELSQITNTYKTQKRVLKSKLTRYKDNWGFTFLGNTMIKEQY
jgi:penicillin-binding protein-related factor A (putative recombinase)